MKKNLLFLLFLILFQNCNLFQNCKKQDDNSSIVYYDNIEYDINNTTEKKNLLNTFSKILSENNVEFRLYYMDILEGIDQSTKKKYTYLLCLDESRSKKMAVLVEYDINKKRFSINDEIYVACYGEADCMPLLYNNNWICDADLETYKCRKTVIVKSVN